MSDYIQTLIARSRAAKEEIYGYSQKQVDQLAAAIIYALSREDVALKIAELTVAETKMGNVESKFNKMAKKMPAVLYQIKDEKTVGVVSVDPETGITKLAKPLGVIAALVPSTNPEATPVFKGVLALRARNSVIFAPHPASAKTTTYVVNLMRQILTQNGAPADLFICIEKPSKDLSAELMASCDITMATGGGPMVRAAYSSGKPAYGVGVGNAAIVIDGTTDLAETANLIMIGKTGDNASGCSAENSLVIQQDYYETMRAQLQKVGGYLATAEEKVRLQAAMWEDGHLSRKIVAKPVSHIAAAANIELPEGTKFIMVEETGIGAGYPFSGEKISLVLTLYKYDQFQQAVDMVNAITGFSGYGHSCGIHSHNQDHILKLANETSTTKVLVRQPHGASNSGAWHNGLANTFSLGCGTWGGNIVSENITQKHYYNITWLSTPIQRDIPGDDEIYGDLLNDVSYVLNLDILDL